jgi:hypothetical protein
LWLSRLLFGPIEPLVARVFLALARAPEAFPDHRAFYSYLFPWIQTAALLLIGAGCVLRVSRCPIYLPRRLGHRPVWEVMAVALLVLDLVSFSAGFNPATDPALLTAEPPSIAFLKQQPGLWRFSTFAPHGQNTLSANAGMIHDLQDVRGYDSLFTAQYVRYMNWIEPQGGLPYNRIAPFTQFSSLDSPLTDCSPSNTSSPRKIPCRNTARSTRIRPSASRNLGVMPPPSPYRKAPPWSWRM